MHALDRIDPAIFNILAIPAAANFNDAGQDTVYSNAEAYCSDKRAFLIVDISGGTDTPAAAMAWLTTHAGLRHRNAAVYFPRLLISDPLNPSQPREVGASGTMAGVYARTDSTRGVWKAPAGIDATLAGTNLVTTLSDLENGELNPQGMNVLRNFAVYGQVSWGARTLRGADQLADEWKYVPVRRTALFIEESLFEGTKWVVFEPNDEPLWAQIRLNLGAFMHNLFRQGAFQGKTPADAYFVKCDKETTTQNDIDLGIVNIVVGFAPLKPAEFVVIKIQQIAGQVAV
jgi:phage tail sheath protein FI